MRIVLQRVLEASVSIDQSVHSSISKGYLLLVGIEQGDQIEQADYLAKKISQLRIFEDEAQKMNLNISQVSGAILSVSQFTLLADTKKGNRPSFSKAADPKEAEALYNYFNTQLRTYDLEVKEGVFGADMQIALENDGPVTLILEK